MQSHTPSTDLFLDALLHDKGQTDRLLLRIGLGGSLACVAIALAGVELLERNGANLMGVILGAIGTVWFLFRIATAHYRWSAILGRVVGWALLSTLPSAFIVAEGLRTDPGVAASSWIPSQLIVMFIAFSALRLRRVEPIWVSLTAAAAYLVAFGYLRTHVPLAVANGESLQWKIGYFRAGTIVGWGVLGAFLVSGLRRALRTAGQRARSGELLGKYRLGEKLGLGGMGEVRRATYCPEGGFVSEVAIKRIHPNLVEEPGMVERFRAEAEVGARLRHHNIVATLDFGRMDDTYFLAMEYVDGESLRKLTRRAARARESFPESVVGYLGQEILAGLGFAHEVATCPQGRPLRVIHRDLCPNNVLLTRSGHVKIADFGVAHVLRDAACFEPTHVVGKVGYLAPESVRGQALDARADLFAVGCILWELLTGEKPFKREDTLTSLHALVECDLAAAPGHAWMSHRWQRFFARALARDPARRFASAQEMSAALAAVVPAPATAEALAGWMRSVDAPFVSLARPPCSEVTAPLPAGAPVAACA